jgi:hypothetical protein
MALVNVTFDQRKWKRSVIAKKNLACRRTYLKYRTAVKCSETDVHIKQRYRPITWASTLVLMCGFTCSVLFLN